MNMEVPAQRLVGRLPGLDGMRAVAVSLVLLVHYREHDASATLFERIVQHGGFGVQIFFVLSGFLITYLLLKEEREASSISLRLFYARRALRIFPPLFIFLFTLFVASRLGALRIHDLDFWAGLFFIRNFIGDSPETGHLWSLAIEEQFYIVWPFFLVLVQRPRIRLAICSAIILLLTIWIHIVSSAGGPINSARTDFQVEPLLIGAVAAIMLFRPISVALIEMFRHYQLSIASAALLILYGAEFSTWANHPGYRAITPTLSYLAVVAIIYCAVLSPQSILTKAFEFPAIAWLGTLSYSLYLWQQPFANHLPQSQPAWFREFPLNLAFAFCLSTASYYVVERPLLGLRRKLQNTQVSSPKERLGANAIEVSSPPTSLSRMGNS